MTYNVLGSLLCLFVCFGVLKIIIIIIIIILIIAALKYLLLRGDFLHSPAAVSDLDSLKLLVYKLCNIYVGTLTIFSPIGVWRLWLWGGVEGLVCLDIYTDG